MLVDGDPAANNGGWQWAAGTGTNAQPYFRIFNPTSQGQKFDPQGTYVRRYVPELANVADRYIHAPWTMPPAEQRRVGVTIGQHYPAPIVDHAVQREQRPGDLPCSTQGGTATADTYEQVTCRGAAAAWQMLSCFCAWSCCSPLR